MRSHFQLSGRHQLRSSWGVILPVEDGAEGNASGVNEGLRYKSNIDLILAPISELYVVQNNL